MHRTHAWWLPQTLGTHMSFPPTCPHPLGLAERFVRVFHKLVWKTRTNLSAVPVDSVLYCFFQFPELEPA